MMHIKFEDRGVIEGLTKLSGGLSTVTAKAIHKFLNDLREKMRKEGKPITYPVKWDSEKQRKAFFATDGFGGGIPHRRTGGYVNSWKVEQSRSGGGQYASGFSLYSAMDAAKYIGGDQLGDYQSNIHEDRWTLLRDEFADTIDELPDEISVAIQNEIRQAGLGD